MRTQDWPELLAAHIDQRKDMPHRFGSNDCCRFVMDAVLSMTGHDPIADLRKIKTAKAIARLLRETPLREIITQRMGEPLPSPLMAQRGDVVMLAQGDDEHLLALCLGETWAAPGPERLEVGDMQRAVCAWAVR